MPLRTRLVTIPLVVALLASGLAVAPAAAFEVLVDEGKTGVPKVKDGLKPGVTCRYEDHPGKIDDELDRVRIRAVKSKGQSKRRTWVGYRTTILRHAPPDPGYAPIFKSKLIKKRASKTDAARWPARRWTPDEDLAASYYRVVITFIYYERGSKTKKAGRVRGVMEVYRHVHPSAPSFVSGKPGDGDACFYNYWT